MAKKLTETKSKRRVTVKQMSESAANLTQGQAKKVRGGNPNVKNILSTAGGNDSIWIDIGAPPTWTYSTQNVTQREGQKSHL